MKIEKQAPIDRNKPADFDHRALVSAALETRGDWVSAETPGAPEKMRTSLIYHVATTLADVRTQDGRIFLRIKD